MSDHYLTNCPTTDTGRRTFVTENDQPPGIPTSKQARDARRTAHEAQKKSSSDKGGDKGGDKKGKKGKGKRKP